MFKRKFILALAGLGFILTQGCGPQSQLHKAQELAAQGRYMEAVVIFKKALSKSAGQPWQSAGWLDLAQSQEQLNALPDAKVSAQTALEAAQNAPDRDNALLVLADIQIRLKDLDGAKKSLDATGTEAAGDSRRAVLEHSLEAALESSGGGEQGFIGLDATRMMVDKVKTIKTIDPAVFPWVQRFVPKGKDTKIISPDGQKELWRGLSRDGYFLFVSDSNGRNIKKLTQCKNAYQPAWAPDSNRIIFSSINWKNRERSLMLYDLSKGIMKEYFKSKKGVGAMAAFSSDGSKIAFIYAGDLWMTNANGIGLSKVNLRDQIKKKVSEASLLAWSKDGSQLVYQPMGFKKIFIITFIRRAS